MDSSPQPRLHAPRRPSEIWQLSVMPMEGAPIGESDGDFAPMPIMIADEHTGLAVGVDVLSPGDTPHEKAVRLLVRSANEITRFAPGQVKVRDAGLAALLKPLLAEYEIDIEVVQSLPELDDMMSDFLEKLLPKLVPAWLAAPGMDMDRLRSFAAAAALFYKAAPWRHLANVDLIHIESPVSPGKALSCVSVMGAAGEVFGLSMLSSVAQFEEVLESNEPNAMGRVGAAALTFEAADRLPAGDAAFWHESQLPLADERAHPLLLRYPEKEGFERLEGPAVTFVEGLCRALAQTTEEQLDSGRWKTTVATHDGKVTYVMSMPRLLEAMGGVKRKYNPETTDRRALEVSMLAIERIMLRHRGKSVEELNEMLHREFPGGIPHLPEPAAPLERAVALCYQAFEAEGRRRIQLAREALRISPDAADAYVILAEQLGADADQANELYRRGMEAGRRALGEAAFDDPEFPFWGMVCSRPYMRARQGYAQTLQAMGRKSEAADEYAAMLELNPGDNQGIRYALAPLLLELNRLDELDALLGGDDFSADASAEWAYVQALLAFRRNARDPAALTTMRNAIRANPHVPKYLLGRAELPPLEPGYYSPGDEREAVIVAYSQRSLWEKSPEALRALEQCKRQMNQSNTQRKRRKRR